MGNPLNVVERQFAAYNRRDLAAFVANFSATIKVYRMPSLVPAITGKEQFSEFYATERFSKPGLRAELLNRIVSGNRVSITSGSGACLRIRSKWSPCSKFRAA